MNIVYINLVVAMFVTFTWGTTAAATHLGFMDWPPLLLAAFRALPAGIVLFLLKPVFPKPGQWRPMLISGFLNITLFFSLAFIFSQNLPATLAAVGTSSTPLIAMLVMIVLQRQLPGFGQIAIALALVGVTALLFNPAVEGVTLIGVVALIAAMVTIVLGSHYLKQAMQTVAWWPLVVWQLILGGLILLPAGIGQWWLNADQYKGAFDWHSARVWSGLWLVLVNTALAYALFLWVLRKISVLQFSFASIANPVAGMLAGAMLVGERFTTMDYGLMLLMIALALVAQLLLQARPTTAQKVDSAAESDANAQRVV